MRRRITNRESAKRMRIKRQEELAGFQKELKRMALENEQLRRLSTQLQKQQIILATDVQHWQNKYANANAEVTALFQQLQQVVALSAAFNPAILEAVGSSVSATAATASPQNPALEALMQALPQTRILSEAMEALRASSTSQQHSAAPTQQFLSAPLPHTPLSLPASSGAFFNLAASRVAAAASADKEAQARSSSQRLRGPYSSPKDGGSDLVQPKAMRPAASGRPMVMEPATSGAELSNELPGLTKQQLKALSATDVEAIIRAARQIEAVKQGA